MAYENLPGIDQYYQLVSRPEATTSQFHQVLGALVREQAPEEVIAHMEALLCMPDPRFFPKWAAHGLQLAVSGRIATVLQEEAVAYCGYFEPQYGVEMDWNKMAVLVAHKRETPAKALKDYLGTEWGCFLFLTSSMEKLTKEDAALLWQDLQVTCANRGGVLIRTFEKRLEHRNVKLPITPAIQQAVQALDALGMEVNTLYNAQQLTVEILNAKTGEARVILKEVLDSLA